MKKSSLLSLSALLALSLFLFTACPDPGNDPETFTVSFDTNGGSTVAQITGVASGAKITKPSDPTKADNTFDGWYKEEGLTTTWDFNTDTVTANTTLYAKWTPAGASTFTVTFNTNGGSTVAQITGVASGAKITKPSDPTKADNTFDGWYKEEGLTTTWDFNTDTVTANTTLYAKWTSSNGNG